MTTASTTSSIGTNSAAEPLLAVTTAINAWSPTGMTIASTEQASASTTNSQNLATPSPALQPSSYTPPAPPPLIPLIAAPPPPFVLEEKASRCKNKAYEIIEFTGSWARAPVITIFLKDILGSFPDLFSHTALKIIAGSQFTLSGLWALFAALARHNESMAQFEKKVLQPGVVLASDIAFFNALSLKFILGPLQAWLENHGFEAEDGGLDPNIFWYWLAATATAGAIYTSISTTCCTIERPNDDRAVINGEAVRMGQKFRHYINLFFDTMVPIGNATLSLFRGKIWEYAIPISSIFTVSPIVLEVLAQKKKIAYKTYESAKQSLGILALSIYNSLLIREAVEDRPEQAGVTIGLISAQLLFPLLVWCCCKPAATTIEIEEVLDNSDEDKRVMTASIASHGQKTAEASSSGELLNSDGESNYRSIPSEPMSTVSTSSVTMQQPAEVACSSFFAGMGKKLQSWCTIFGSNEKNPAVPLDGKKVVAKV